MAGPSVYDLVRLADLGIGEDTDGAVQRLITAVSRTILTAINRPAILPRRYTEVREAGTSGVMLANWPVIAIQSVARGPETLLVAATGADVSGWTLEPADDAPPGGPQMLTLGRLGGRGAPPVTVVYTAGYQVTNEPVTVPNGSPFSVTAAGPYGAWASDVAVSSAAGIPFARVAASPAASQYAVDAQGTYTLSSADAGAPMLLSYGYVPADLANAAIDWIRDRLAYAERVGMQSKSLGGQETVSYRISAVPDFVKAALQPYAAVVPLC